MSLYTVACPACQQEIPAIAAVCRHCGKGFSPNVKVSQLQAYVGSNWNSHYEATFIKLLNAREQGTTCDDWTWNWSAALLGPFWFFHRRLYLAGFGVGLLVFSIVLLQRVIVKVDWAGAETFATGLNGLWLFVNGFFADRLLFRKAYKEVTSLPRNNSF